MLPPHSEAGEAHIRQQDESPNLQEQPEKGCEGTLRYRCQLWKRYPATALCETQLGETMVALSSNEYKQAPVFEDGRLMIDSTLSDLFRIRYPNKQLRKSIIYMILESPGG